MARYTASPLGLIPDFSSDIKNFRYKTVADSSGDKNPNIQKSIFSSTHDIQRASNDPNDKTPLSYNNLHTEDRYDLSTTNVIKQLSGINSMRLKYSDFAYCRDFGVYPNNRLIVCRKFDGPVGDDLNRQKNRTPLATVVSWFDDTSLPVSIDFGVKWTEAEAGFKGVLSNMGKDLGLDKIFDLGEVATKGINFLPLPGIFEPFTRKILQNINIGGSPIIGPGDPSAIPAGQPNLIKEAKQRTLIGDETAGSGLKGVITVTVKCSWEQKFIGGQDPTNVYYDLLRTILHFGGEDGTFYMGGGAGLNNLLGKFLDALEHPEKIIKGLLEGLAAAMKSVIDSVTTLIKKFFDESKIPENTAEEPEKSTTETTDAQKKPALSEADKAKNDEADKNKGLVLGVINTLLSSIKDLTKGLGAKYKHVLMGIVSALTGAPSTPWHVTIGNPLRPIFCSGDMYTDGVKLTLGPTLAFNDLPSSVDIDFTLTSARTCGIDEIFRKLSTGEIRFSSSSAPSFYNTNQGEEEPKKPENSPPVTDSKNEELTDGTQPFDVTDKTKIGSTNPVGLTASTGAKVNPDPNSPPIQAPIQNKDPNASPAQAPIQNTTPNANPAQAPIQNTTPNEATSAENTSSPFNLRKAVAQARETADDRLSGITTRVTELLPETWNVGKGQSSGSKSQTSEGQSIFTKWRVLNGTSPGTFIANWDLADKNYGSLLSNNSGGAKGQGEAIFGNLSEAITGAKTNLELEFNKALVNKGIPKI